MADRRIDTTRPASVRAAVMLVWTLGGITAALVWGTDDGAGFTVAGLSRSLSSELVLAALGVSAGEAAFAPLTKRPRMFADAAAAAIVLAALFTTSSRIILGHAPRNLIAFAWGFFGSVPLIARGQERNRVAAFALTLTEFSAVLTLAWVGETAARSMAAIAAHLALLGGSFLLLEAARRKASRQREAPAGNNSRTDNPQQSKPSGLTPREQEVVDRLARGETQVEIAEALGISPSTVSTYRTRALRKLGADTIEVKAPVRLMTLEDDYLPAAHLVLPVSLLAATSALLCIIDLASGRLTRFRAIACTVAAALPLVGELTNRSQPLRNCEPKPLNLCLALGAGILTRELLIWRDALPTSLALLAGCAATSLAPMIREGRARATRQSRRRSTQECCLFAAALLLRQFPGNDVATVRIGPLSGTSAEVTPILIAALAIFLVWYFSTHLLTESEETPRATPELADRYLNYLLAKGLNQTQAHVALDIAQGLSQSQIASKECISAGAINSARLIAYQKLGVSSRRELVRVLEREIT